MTRRRGAVLAGVLFALMLIGGLVAVAFIPAFEESRAGRSTLRLVQATAAAESGPDEILGAWFTSGFDTMGIGDTARLESASLASRTGWFRAELLRPSEGFYFARVEGYSRDSLARRSLGAMIRLEPLPLDLPGVLNSDAVPVVSGSVLGIDSAGSRRGCTSTAVSRESKPGAATATALVTEARSRIRGRSHLVIGPGAHRDLVDSSSLLIEVTGPARLLEGDVSGTIVATGPLVLGPNLAFRGVVLVDGDLTIVGSSIYGGIVVSGSGSRVKVTQATLKFATCSIARSSADLGDPRLLWQRGFIQLS